ncbi:MAG: hypothetical protein V4616_10240 [Bacteroidota bacterium]
MKNPIISLTFVLFIIWNGNGVAQNVILKKELYNEMTKTIGEQGEEILRNRDYISLLERAKLGADVAAALPPGGSPFQLTSFLFSNAPRGFAVSYSRHQFMGKNIETPSIPVINVDFFNKWSKRLPIVEKVQWFEYYTVRMNGSFSKSSSLALNPTGISFVDGLKNTTNDGLGAVQEYATPSAAELLLYTNLGAYAGTNIAVYRNCNEWFLTVDAGISGTFTQINLNPAIELASDATDAVAKRIVDLTFQNTPDSDSQIRTLSRITDALSDLPQAAKAVNLKPVNVPFPLLYAGPSVTLGKGLNSDLADKNCPGLSIQGYAQVLKNIYTPKLTNLVYDVQDNVITDDKANVLRQLSELDIDVKDASVMKEKQRYNNGLLNAGIRITAQFRSLALFGGVQYSTTLSSQRKTDFFNDYNKKNLVSYNLGFMLDLTSKNADKICKKVVG